MTAKVSAHAKLTDKGSAPTRLIALEGTHGPDLVAAAGLLERKLRDRKQECGVSRWDSSNTFFEMRFAKSHILTPSPRTLLLLYASDLVFRLRWEIRPALEEGKIMIAAPYVESAIAFGVAAGLPRNWLVELFGFAPRPEACYRLKEKKKHWHRKCEPGDGFLEFCAALLSSSHPSWNPEGLRLKSLEYLEALENRQGCQPLKKKAVAEICSRR